MLFLLLNHNKLNENYTNNDLLAYCIKIVMKKMNLLILK